MIYLPSWMYELMPYLYLSVGGMAALGVDPAWGRVSGLLLIGMAAVILKLRIDNRRSALTF